MSDDAVIRAWWAGDEVAIARALGAASMEHAFRPRDEWDVDVDPESLRGKILEIYDAYDAMPWWLRMLARIVARFRRTPATRDKAAAR